MAHIINSWRSSYLAYLACLAYLTYPTYPTYPTYFSPQELNQPARISGRVVAAETGVPVRGAFVELTGGAVPAPSVVTDADGRFEFLERRIGRYAVQAVKAGYVPYLFGRLTDQSDMFDVLAGQRIDRGTIRLSQAAVISGRVYDDAGETISSVTVTAWRIEFPLPGIQLLQWIKDVPTDDLGDYRLHGLMPGRYRIAASQHPQSADERSPVQELEARLAAERARAVWPGPGLPTVSSAITADGVAGGDTSGMNLTVMRPRYARVSGTVVDTEGRPVTAGMVTLQPVHAEGGVMGRRYSQVALQAGRFSFTKVPAGDYRVSANYARGDARPEYRAVIANESATVSINVREDVSDLVLRATLPFLLSGRVFIDGAPADSATRLRLFGVPRGVPALDALFSGPVLQGQPVTVTKAGTFSVISGAGFVVLRVGDSMGLRSVMADGVDVTDGFEVMRAMTVDVHLASQVSVLEGIVKPSDGVIRGDCDVVVFAAEPTHWRTPMSRRVVTVRCDDKGKFRVTGLPTGQYLAALAADFDRRVWADPDRLERLRLFATPFSVTEGAITEVRIEVKR